MFNKVFNKTTLVSKGSGCLTDVFITASASGAKVIVYDGQNDKGDIIAVVNCGDNLSAPYSPRTWPEFHSGLYIVVSGTDPYVSIGYR